MCTDLILILIMVVIKPPSCLGRGTWRSYDSQVPHCATWSIAWWTHPTLRESTCSLLDRSKKNVEPCVPLLIRLGTATAPHWYTPFPYQYIDNPLHLKCPEPFMRFIPILEGVLGIEWTHQPGHTLKRLRAHHSVQQVHFLFVTGCLQKQVMQFLIGAWCTKVWLRCYLVQTPFFMPLCTLSIVADRIITKWAGRHCVGSKLDRLTYAKAGYMILKSSKLGGASVTSSSLIRGLTYIDSLVPWIVASYEATRMLSTVASTRTEGTSGTTVMHTD